MIILSSIEPSQIVLKTKKWREIKKILNNPYFIGVTLGFFIATRLWNAGYDASLYYLRYPPQNATVPIWIYYLTYPLSLVGWPLSWQIFVVISVILVSLVYALRGNHRWWLVVASSAFLYNAWWGQIEVFSVIGLALSLLIIDRRISIGWLGIAWLLMAVKPQVNYGMIILFLWWIWKTHGIKSLLLPSIIFLFVASTTVIIFPGWIDRLLITLKSLISGDANASVWPYGLLAWPLVILSRTSNFNTKIRMVAAATLLGSPYFTLHHCLTLLVLTDSPIGLILSWLPIVMIAITRDWSQFAWIIPLGIMFSDLWNLWKVKMDKIISHQNEFT